MSCEPGQPPVSGADCVRQLLEGRPGGAHEQAEFITPSGAGCRLDDFAGRWLLINYWATWCAPCRVEIPELNQLHRRGELLVLGVNYDDLPEEELREAARSFAVEFILLREDPAARLGYARPEVLPTSYLFGPDGKLREVLQGPRTRAELLALLTSATSATSASSDAPPGETTPP